MPFNDIARASHGHKNQLRISGGMSDGKICSALSLCEKKIKAFTRLLRSHYMGP